jgi:hypothetical protein
MGYLSREFLTEITIYHRKLATLRLVVERTTDESRLEQCVEEAGHALGNVVNHGYIAPNDALQESRILSGLKRRGDHVDTRKKTIGSALKGFQSTAEEMVGYQILVTWHEERSGVDERFMSRAQGLGKWYFRQKIPPIDHFVKKTTVVGRLIAALR